MLRLAKEQWLARCKEHQDKEGGPKATKSGGYGYQPRNKGGGGGNNLKDGA